MVLDTSAAVAIALGEPERSQFLQQVIEADKVLISAATFIEIAIVLENRVGPAATREMETFLRSLGAEIVSVDSVQAEQAQLTSEFAAALKRTNDLAQSETYYRMADRLMPSAAWRKEAEDASAESKRMQWNELRRPIISGNIEQDRIVQPMIARGGSR